MISIFFRRRLGIVSIEVGVTCSPVLLAIVVAIGDCLVGEQGHRSGESPERSSRELIAIDDVKARGRRRLCTAAVAFAVVFNVPVGPSIIRNRFSRNDDTPPCSTRDCARIPDTGTSLHVAREFVPDQGVTRLFPSFGLACGQRR